MMLGRERVGAAVAGQVNTNPARKDTKVFSNLLSTDIQIFGVKNLDKIFLKEFSFSIEKLNDNALVGILATPSSFRSGRVF